MNQNIYFKSLITPAIIIIISITSLTIYNLELLSQSKEALIYQQNIENIIFISILLIILSILFLLLFTKNIKNQIKEYITNEEKNDTKIRIQTKLLTKEKFLRTMTELKANISSLYANFYDVIVYLNNVKRILLKVMEIVAVDIKTLNSLRDDTLKEILKNKKIYSSHTLDIKDISINPETSHIIISILNDPYLKDDKTLLIMQLKIEDEMLNIWENFIEDLSSTIQMGLKNIFNQDEKENLINRLHQSMAEQKKQERIILTQSKTAAVGEMLGNIAHQWRQPLSIITTNVSGIQVSLDFGENITNEQINECATGVLKQAKYLSQTIDDFRSFFSSNSIKIENINLKHSLNKLESLIKDTYINNHIKIIDNKNDCKMLINETILIQGLLNIFNNAKDAMVLNNIDSDNRYFFIDLHCTSDEVVIKLKDSGGGIEDDIIDKIFEPYFTTKHESIGTGIGLYMTHQIITKNLKGTLEVNNMSYNYDGKELRGVEFKVVLPIS